MTATNEIIVVPFAVAVVAVVSTGGLTFATSLGHFGGFFTTFRAAVAAQMILKAMGEIKEAEKLPWHGQSTR